MEYRDSRPEDHQAIVHCIYHGFTREFRPLMAGEESVKKICLNMIKLDQFKVATKNNQVIACCGAGSCASRLYKKNKGVFTKEFGLIKGLIAERVIRHILGRPINADPACGYLEFVTVLPEYRRQGIMRGLLNWTFNQGEYPCYMLDVASNNHNAIRLYKDLGFKESHRSKKMFTGKAGPKHKIYMKK